MRVSSPKPHEEMAGASVARTTPMAVVAVMLASAQVGRPDTQANLKVKEIKNTPPIQDFILANSGSCFHNAYIHM